MKPKMILQNISISDRLLVRLPRERERERERETSGTRTRYIRGDSATKLTKIKIITKEY